ncbi:hypothetical protein VTH06DRAFT_6036 [Thermothelomyces fergusii]
MDSYQKFLVENVLAEDKVITYRLLSRALKIHVNTAKQMLYEFHRNQNAKRPGAVYATYLIYGTKRALDKAPAPQHGNDGDVEMASSAPETESPDEVVPTLTLSLVPEEQLKEILAEYEQVSSIHIYSVGPHPTKDMALLVDAANQARSLSSGDDLKSLVPITNPRVRRRERQGPGFIAAAAPTAQTHAPAKTTSSNAVQPTAPEKTKEVSKSAPPSQETTDKGSASGPTKKPAPSSKRGPSSGIMQAFSKATAKAAKVKKEADTPQTTAPDNEEPSVQPLSDDGEDDDELPQPKPRSASAFKTKKQREEELRRMMEEDDEEEASGKAETPEEKPVEEEMEEEPQAPEPVKEEEKEIVTASANGRRRGKRRVMRKKQIMDDQGYLVTIQEPGWESFSEDETPPPAKPKTTSSAAPTQAAKPKKSGQKGQGSIMSFFSKK